MNTKSGCGRLDLSAFKGKGVRATWPTAATEAAPVEARTWRPAELDRPDLASLFEPRAN